MNIAYVGNFQWPWCTEVHVARTLTDMGHRVITVQENVTNDRDMLNVIDGTKPERAYGPIDLLLVTRCWGWTPGYYLRGAIETCKGRGIPTASLHLDRFAGLPERLDHVRTDPMFQVDTVFTADGDFPWDEYGVHHHWLRAGVLRDECYHAEPFTPAELRERGLPDEPLVGFVGSDGYHPEWPHRGELVKWLQRRYGTRFLQLGGSRGAVRGDDLNRVYASCPVFVGDSIFAKPDSHYWSDRPYETWGRGGTLVFPRFDALVGEVGPYPYWTVGEWDQLGQVIDRVLENPEVAQDQARDLHEYVREHCTYHQRLTELLGAMGV